MLRMRRAWLWSVLIGLWLVLALPALAQSGSVRVEDPDNLLGGQAGAVREAAQQLANQGAQVIVLAAKDAAGADETSALAYLDSFLTRNNIAPSKDQLLPSQIVFYVPVSARLSALYYGAQWRAKLDPVQNSIRNESMSPRFAAGDIAGGLVAGIDAARTTINPPTSPVVYVLGGTLAAAGATAVALPVVRRRRASAETLTQARERWAQARRSAGAAIADLGQLVNTAQQKAEYDRISYSQGDLDRLTQLQSKGVSVFQEAQAAFDAAEEQQHAKATLAAGDYTAIAEQYAGAQQLAQQATQLIREAEALRATLDARGAPSTGPTTRLGE